MLNMMIRNTDYYFYIKQKYKKYARKHLYLYETYQNKK